MAKLSFNLLIEQEQDPFFLNFLLNPTPSADKLEQFFSEEEMTCEDFTAADLKAAGGTMLAPGAGAGGIGGTWWT